MKVNALLNSILATDKNLIQREYFGISFQQKIAEKLAESSHSTIKDMQTYMKGILLRVKEHD